MSTTSTKGDSAFSTFALSDSALDEETCYRSLTITDIAGCLIVTFVTINKMDMVDDTESEIQYINTNPLNLEWS